MVEIKVWRAGMRPPLSRLLMGFAVVAPCLAGPPAHPTAVFTLDVERRQFVDEPGKSAKAQFQAWAESCAIVPRGPVYGLECPVTERAPLRDADDDNAQVVDASLTLFRDLDEVVYLAGCPVIEEPGSDRPGERSRQAEDALGAKSSPTGVSEKDLENCKDIDAGQTFTTEVEGEFVTIVIRGAQLPMTLFRVQPKKVSFNSPYEPKRAKMRPARGSTSAPTSARSPEPGAEPDFRPPPLGDLSRGRPSAKGATNTPTGKTSLRTGRLVLECSSSQAAVYIDDAYYGACPVELPLLAGPHDVRLQRPGRDDWVRQVEIQAGETVRLQAR